MEKNIAAIRQTYSQKELLEKDAASNPIKQFEQWWNDAVNAEISEVNAMTLATAAADGMPSARIVLLKDFSEQGFSFFTNYESYKGRQLAENPKACLVFFWKEMERQVRITGLVQQLPEADSDAYFYSRPIESQAGAITSPQSQIIESREWLLNQYKSISEQVKKIGSKRPAHWGGYIVKPVIIEFWQGRPGRMHDRLQYTLQQDGSWKIERLAP
ncbi:MAG TPA: pyridoxamine 5'-phosphate oxidase [Chitinophagaceae bacterium]|jgi:pyridoxamine 5'-phosphate oxidase|nr:pyridoxamine 5'-phosphate oxidase [Chitinophagaceae bacterium]